MIKRTYWLAESNHDKYNSFRAEKKITCTCVGEMADGYKVWEDESGKQYYAFRMENIYYFAHM